MHAEIYRSRLRFCENIYIGWAQKYTGSNFSPHSIPALMDEFPSGFEITEVDDPAPEEEEEAAWRAAQAQLAERNAQEDEEVDEEGEESDGDYDDKE